jgi:UDP-N-acetylglucosamine 3-dehydrogenase
VNVLLVGAGRWGEKHLRVLRAIGATLWVAELSPERRAWAVEHGVDRARVVADYRDALGSVQAVDIVTPTDSHLVVAEVSMRAGAHCFVEKPLSLTGGEGRRLADVAAATGRILQVGHIFRFHPVTATLRQALPRLGALRYATGRFSGFKRPRTDVGVTHTDAIHYFDLFAFLFGRAATSVSAFQRDYLGRGLDDLSVTVVHYGDLPAIVEANYFVPGTHRDCVIVGEHGALVADYAASTVTFYASAHRKTDTAWEAVDTGKEELPAGGPEPLRLELEAFRDACASAGPSPVPVSAGVAAVEIVDAAARSAALGRVVGLDEVR